MGRILGRKQKIRNSTALKAMSVYKDYMGGVPVLDIRKKWPNKKTGKPMCDTNVYYLIRFHERNNSHE